MMTRCEECGLLYCEDIVEDRKEHRSRHRRRSLVARTLGYLPRTYFAQEQSKREGWTLIASGETLEDRVHGAEMVLRGWFDRSLEAAIKGNYWRQHPAFPSFARMMFAGGPSFGEDVRDVLFAKYGLPVEGEIAPGGSYWHLPKSRARAEQWQAHRAYLNAKARDRIAREKDYAAEGNR